MKLRILIADDHEVVRRGLCALLQAREGWEICAEAKDGREAVEKAAQLKPDVVILDVCIPNLNGLAATRQLTQHDPHCKVFVLTITDSDQVIREALDAGDRGVDVAFGGGWHAAEMFFGGRFGDADPFGRRRGSPPPVDVEAAVGHLELVAVGQHRKCHQEMSSFTTLALLSPGTRVAVAPTSSCSSAWTRRSGSRILA